MSMISRHIYTHISKSLVLVELKLFLNIQQRLVVHDYWCRIPQSEMYAHKAKNWSSEQITHIGMRK